MENSTKMTPEFGEEKRSDLKRNSAVRYGAIIPMAGILTLGLMVTMAGLVASDFTDSRLFFGCNLRRIESVVCVSIQTLPNHTVANRVFYNKESLTRRSTSKAMRLH